MRILSLTITLISTLTIPTFAQEGPNYDLAPGALPGHSPTPPVDDMWDEQYIWEAELITGDGSMMGISFDGENVWFSGIGVSPNLPTIYVIEPETSVLLSQFTTSYGVRDMCFDGNYIYGAGSAAYILGWDPATYSVADTINFPGARCIAYNPASDHFYVASGFSGTCYVIDRQGHVISSWAPAPLSAVYGFAFDDDGPGGPWLWIHDQSTPVAGCNVHQFDPATLCLTGVCVNLGLGMAGGIDYCDNLVEGYSSILIISQGNPDQAHAFEMYPIGPTPDYDWTVTLTATGATTIPAGGGNLAYNVVIHSNETIATTGQLWTNATLPNGSTFNLIGPITINMPADHTIERDKDLYVPMGAPAGAYSYNVMVGMMNAITWDEDSIPFTKTGDGVGGGQWYSWGEPFPGETVVEPEVPTDFAVMSAYPNPFNAKTTIDFTLSENGRVNLTVYDIQGRSVTELVDGFISKGVHSVEFNAALLPSGVYFYRLESKLNSKTKKMILVK